MDQQLKELCMEVLLNNVDSERFTSLLVETGIQLEDPEWNIATRIIEKGDSMNRWIQNLERNLQ